MSVHFVRTTIPALEAMRAVRFRSLGTQHTMSGGSYAFSSDYAGTKGLQSVRVGLSA